MELLSYDLKTYTRIKILPLLEQLVFDTWYGDKESKKVDDKNKQVLPQKIFDMIMSYI